MEPLNEYPTSELESLLQVIEAACIQDPQTALQMDKWYERVKEALNQSYSENYEAEYHDLERMNDFDLPNDWRNE